MPSKRTNNFPESERGLGHVTPTIFGSTVGYPSDSLASCHVSCQLSRKRREDRARLLRPRPIWKIPLHCYRTCRFATFHSP